MDFIPLLKDRAQMLARSRDFFASRNVLEVDCPCLTSSASVDAHIDLITAYNGTEKRFLHTSPEYAMKRLLIAGAPDIYQLGHVFRAGERGRKHNPEFTLVEWYRREFSFQNMIDETADYCSLFLGSVPRLQMTYKDTFITYCAVNPFTASCSDLLAFIHDRKIPAYRDIVSESKDALLNLILGTFIEPQLGQEGLFILTHYPASQAALARTCQLNAEEKAAERFEIYFKGVELANGYHELGNALEQRARFMQANEERLKMGKEALPLDEWFLDGLEKKTLPDCCGVAVGFDRLLMLKNRVSSLDAILPFSWEKI